MIEKTVLKNTYRDSVFLMVISQEVHQIAGVAEVVVMMGTDNNKKIIKDVGFKDPMLETATPRDMLICIRADNENVIEDVLSKIDEMLSRKPTQGKSEGVFKTLDSAVKENSSINFAVISVPGDFAAREAKKALTLGLNVLLFSDNVSIEEEIELKNLASRFDRILMGPDCGTAIINKVPLAFANVVRAGSIGVVAAAGTGQQEVVSLIDQNGGGISQSMGTGGRDVTDVVGGISMLKGIEILEKDKETEIIILVSKPPGQVTMRKVLQRLQTAKKKSVVCFLGGDPNVIAQYGIIPATTIEECALRAVATVEGRTFEYKHFSRSESEINALVKKETKQMSKGQKYLRGLYSGGTLCDEAMLILSGAIGSVYSNIPLKSEYKIKDPTKGYLNSCIDLGDDFFTKGRPHPMIDPQTRRIFIGKDSEDPEVGVLLLDVVLGYGSHNDMAGALAGCIADAKTTVSQRGGYLSVVASVTGTQNDPQNFADQTKKLADAGAIVMPSNAQAARLAARICKVINNQA